MGRIQLIHWKAEEAPERLARIEDAGHEAGYTPAGGPPLLRALREGNPDAVVVDLSRIPSQGRDAAMAIRRQKATRHIPLVFVEGEAEKVERVKQVLPDAVYSSWEDVGAAIREAVESAPADPAVPGAMDGYSGTPLPKKLGIRPAATVALLDAPKGFEKTLGALPEGVRVKRQARGSADVVLLFARSQAEMARRFPVAGRVLAERGRLWLVWPKKASGVQTDLTQVTVRSLGMGSGFVDYKISAIDETWSGLCFARKDPEA